MESVILLPDSCDSCVYNVEVTSRAGAKKRSNGECMADPCLHKTIVFSLLLLGLSSLSMVSTSRHVE